MDEQGNTETDHFQEAEKKELINTAPSLLNIVNPKITTGGVIMSTDFTESIVEEASLSWFEELGYTFLNGGTIAPGELDAERSNYGEVILADRLNAALAIINPHIPHDALDEVFRKFSRANNP